MWTVFEFLRLGDQVEVADVRLVAVAAGRRWRSSSGGGAGTAAALETQSAPSVYPVGRFNPVQTVADLVHVLTQARMHY